MQFRMKFLALIFGVLTLANIANAESPREQLTQMVEQLQKAPSDAALREKIIKLAQEMKPAPAVPEEADRRMVRGTAALRGTKSVADYRDAAKEFELATLAAPWYGDAYFNLGVAQDKAENYEAALRSLKLALLASPNDKEIKTLIYEVEYRNDKVNSAVAAVEQEKRAKKEFIEKLDGAQWQRDNKYDKSSCADHTYEIHRGEIYQGWVVSRFIREGCMGEPKLGHGWFLYKVRVEGRDFVIEQGDQSNIRGTISEDGEIITTIDRSGYSQTYRRVKNPQGSVLNTN